MTEPPQPVQERTWDDLQSVFQQLEQHRNDKDRQLFELIKMIKEYDLPIENCRSMFESYCKKQNLTKSGWKSFFRHLEHRIECMQRALEEMDVFKVVEKVGGFVGSISIIGAALVYIFSDLPQRTIQTQYEAWEIVRENQGDRASGGRIEAIESLNKQNVSLAEINLENAILPEINLSGADLWGANLKRIRFRGADLSNANLSHANLSEAKLTNTIVKESEERHNYNNYNYNIHGQINLKGADLTDADLSHADLRSDKTNLNQAKLIGASLLYAKLSDADLSFAKLQRCELSNLGSIVSGNGKFFHPEPSDTCDSEESVYKKILNGADPNNDANIKRRLEQSLAGANLNHADLRKANLSRANLSNANLLYANLEEANLKDVILKKAIYNNKTRFPKGFAPKAYQAILVERGANLKHRDLMFVNLSGVDLSSDKQ
ncbi:MAG TPA: hypothetical protein DEV81_19385, partial [Cyanobacteria bacterium UBA11049]|nr:hypothetical protein [Cyanobacteria bacterium UBA11049]